MPCRSFCSSLPFLNRSFPFEECRLIFVTGMIRRLAVRSGATPCLIQPNRLNANIPTHWRKTHAAQSPHELTHPPFCQPLTRPRRHAQLLARLLLSSVLSALRAKLGGSEFMETFPTIGASGDSDGALVTAAKCGDTHAFEELVLRYKRRVFAMAQRITNNHEDAEDVVQESFHKAFLHLREFQEKSQFSTWLTRIAMNQAL